MTILDSANKNTSESSNIKQKEIENRSINSHSSSDFESKEGSISSENLPILCFLVQRFILSFPIIHEQVTKTSKNLSSPVKANAPIYWNTGLLPLLRRLYKCNLSASIDLGTPGFLNAVCAFSGTKFIERLLATSLELVFKNASNLSGNRSNSIHLPYEGNSAQKIYEEARSNFFSKKYRGPLMHFITPKELRKNSHPKGIFIATKVLNHIFLLKKKTMKNFCLGLVRNLKGFLQ
ncbi:hypothetical protein BY996DRAFT_3865537 [Phakopsora pachyrhizi]|nr:hypothetical protein BY996DRAFT_3865537 [Phakopsora pachyrhizi]